MQAVNSFTREPSFDKSIKSSFRVTTRRLSVRSLVESSLRVKGSEGSRIRTAKGAVRTGVKLHGENTVSKDVQGGDHYRVEVACAPDIKVGYANVRVSDGRYERTMED